VRKHTRIKSRSLFWVNSYLYFSSGSVGAAALSSKIREAYSTTRIKYLTDIWLLCSLVKIPLTTVMRISSNSWWFTTGSICCDSSFSIEPELRYYSASGRQVTGRIRRKRVSGVALTSFPSLVLPMSFVKPDQIKFSRRKWHLGRGGSRRSCSSESCRTRLAASKK